MHNFIERNFGVSAILGILAALCIGFVAGIWSAESKDIVGAMGNVLGGIVGALGAAVAVYLTFEGQRKIERDKVQALIKALWNDACCLQDLAYREAQWWKNELKDSRFGATEERLLDHFESVVLDNNLHRIGDIPDRIVDALLVMRSWTNVVKSAHKSFYACEDKIFEHVKIGKLSEKEGNDRLRLNKKKTFDGLCRVSVAARAAALLLDPAHAFEKERQATYSSEEWAVRGPELLAMNEFTDAILRAMQAGKNI